MSWKEAWNKIRDRKILSAVFYLIVLAVIIGIAGMFLGFW